MKCIGLCQLPTSHGGLEDAAEFKALSIPYTWVALLELVEASGCSLPSQGQQQRRTERLGHPPACKHGLVETSLCTLLMLMLPLSPFLREAPWPAWCSGR